MRIGRNQSGTITLSLGVVSMSLCAALGAIFLRSGGLPNRFDPMVTQIGKVRNERFGFACVPYPAVSETPFSNSCRLGSTDQRAGDFLLWGDSHARQYSALVSEDANRTGRVGVAATLGNCPPLHGMIRLDHPTPRHCAEFNEDVLGYLASHPEVKTVILSGIWAVYAEGTSVDGTPKGPFVDVTSASVPRMRANVFETGIRRMTQALVGLGRQVYIIGPSPEPGWDVPAELQRSIAYGKNPPTAISLDVFHARQRMVLRVLDSLESVPGVSVIYPHRALCSEGACRYRNDGDPLYFDGNHLSAAGVRAAFPQGLPMFAPR